MLRTPNKLILAAVVALAAAAPAWAQGKQPPPAARGYGAVLDNIDLLIDHYAGFLGRKYDLTDEQDQYTREMLRERAHEFLDAHEDELRGLIDQLFEVRSGGEMTQEQLIEWGKRAQPLYQEAKKLIIDGNDDWREILTPEQKKIHDEDLRLMEQSFATTEDQLDRIVSGQMTVEEFRNPRRSVRRRTATPAQTATTNPPPPPPDVAPPPPSAQPTPLNPPHPGEEATMRPVRRMSPKTPSEPGAVAPRPREVTPSRRPNTPATPEASARRRPEPTARTSGSDYQSQWDKYVEDFIQRYKLDDAQQQQAHSILNDCKTQASRYLQGRKSTIDRIDKQIAALKAAVSGQGADARKRSQQVSELNKQKDKLREPVGRIFEKQLKPRLERIPTRAQRREAEKAASKPKRSKKSKPGKSNTTGGG